jgi:pSer/pThr/pTyr-binding forkhead associated (FHA) protein
MIMESVKSAPAKVIHVFNLQDTDLFKIGRSVETDMKIADISVSRVHAFIKIKNGDVFLEDNGSKFGTLVKINSPLALMSTSKD